MPNIPRSRWPSGTRRAASTTIRTRNDPLRRKAAGDPRRPRTRPEGHGGRPAGLAGLPLGHGARPPRQAEPPLRLGPSYMLERQPPLSSFMLAFGMYGADFVNLAAIFS